MKGGGLSAHQAHSAYRSTQTGEVRLFSLQSKDLVHTRSTGLFCLYVEYSLSIDQRDDSVLRKYTAHLYNRPREAGEGGLLLRVHR